MSALLRCHGLSEDEEEKGEVERDTGNSIVVVVLLLLLLLSLCCCCCCCVVVVVIALPCHALHCLSLFVVS